MPKSLLTFWLHELNTVRLVCQKSSCNAVVELTVAQLANVETSHCPVCSKPHVYSDHKSAARLQQLAIAIENARQSPMDELVKVEFVLSEKQN